MNRAPKWLRPYLPNHSDRLALVSLDDERPFRAHWPLRLTQIVGGRTWSLSLVRYQTPTPTPTTAPVTSDVDEAPAPSDPASRLGGGWNYRLVTAPEGTGEALVLTEVYYDTDGAPHGYIADGVNFGGDTPQDIAWALTHALDACAQPTLTAADFTRPSRDGHPGDPGGPGDPPVS